MHLRSRGEREREGGGEGRKGEMKNVVKGREKKRKKKGGERKRKGERRETHLNR